MEAKPSSIVQVSNINYTISKDQIQHFLEYIGRIRDMQLYPTGEVDSNITKVAYVKFDSPEHVDVALHLTNTVMVDRALILLPYPDDEIPEENKGLRIAAPTATVAGMLPPTKEWPANVVNMIVGTGTQQTIQTIDPRFAELGLPQYPPLPAKTDASKVENIRRTVYITNLEPTVTAEQLVQFFSQAGEVMYIRMAGDENLPSRSAYVEFTHQKSVPTALAYNGMQLGQRQVKVIHSLHVIQGKPQTKGQEQMTRDIDEAMKKFKDVDKLISAAASTATKNTSRSSRRSRSRSHDRSSRRHKSRERRKSKERRRTPSPRRPSRRTSRDRRRRSRSRSKDKKRSRSKDKKRSRSKDRKRSRSKDKKRSRSRDRKRSRSRGRNRSRDRRRRSKSRDRRRSRSRDKKSSRRRSSSRDRKKDGGSKDGKSRDRVSKDKDGVKVKRDYDAEENDMENGVKSEPSGAKETNGTTTQDPMLELESKLNSSEPLDRNHGLKPEPMDITD